MHSGSRISLFDFFIPFYVGQKIKNEMTSFREGETMLFPTLNWQDFVNFLWLLNMVWIVQICSVLDPQHCEYGSGTGIETFPKLDPGPEPQKAVMVPQHSVEKQEPHY
jgi:hypothetical protein